MKTIYALQPDVVDVATNVVASAGMTRMGGWQTILGRAVRERRQGLGLTLEEASAAVGISRSHLNLIELGKATGISRESVAKIDLGLGADGALLTLLPPSGDSRNVAGDTAGDEEMRRAEFNKTVVAVAAGLLLDSERLVAPQRADVALLEDLESLTAEFVRRQHHAQPQAILGPLRAHLRHLLDLEGARVAPNLRPRLERVTAETAAVAGWIAFRGEGDLVTAHGQLALGRQHACEAGDGELLAQLLGVSSSLYSALDIPHVDRNQGALLALSLLQAAERKAGSRNKALRGWLAARVGVERAVCGEARKARGALSRAEALVPSDRASHAGLFVIWDETRVPGYTGKALLLLRDPAATTLLEQALAQTSAPHPRLGLLVDLSLARVYERDADHAVALLLEAMQLAVAHGIDRFARWRLQEGRSALPPAHQRAFDDQLHAIA